MLLVKLILSLYSHFAPHNPDPTLPPADLPSYTRAEYVDDLLITNYDLHIFFAMIYLRRLDSSPVFLSLSQKTSFCAAVANPYPASRKRLAGGPAEHRRSANGGIAREPLRRT